MQAELNFNVLIEREKDSSVTATVLGLPECKANGTNREEALTNLRHLLTARLQKSEIISLAINPQGKEHPWLKFSGMLKDDPDFEEMLADIEAYRREVDTEDETK